MQIKAVIYGTAHMHANEIAMYINEDPDTVLVGVSDLAPDIPELCSKRYTRGWNLKNISETYSVPVFSDPDTMLAETKPDIAFILCENAKKPEAVLACAKRGINVVIEKPMAVSMEAAKQIEETVRKYKIEAYVNWPVVWRPYVKEMMDVVRSGLIGEPIRVRYLNGHTGPLGKGARHRGVAADAEAMTDAEREVTWWHRKEAGGGTFLDICCYGCLYTEWVLGDGAENVFAEGVNLATDFGNTEDNVAAIIRYPKALSVIEATWTTPNIAVPSGPSVVGREGAVVCTFDSEHKPGIAIYDIFGKPIERKEYKHPAEYLNIVANYAAYKKNGFPMLDAVTLDFNLKAMGILDAAIRSGKTGKTEPVGK